MAGMTWRRKQLKSVVLFYQSLYNSTEFRNYITSTAYKDLFTNTAGYPTIQVKNAKYTTKQIIFLVKS